MYKELKEVYDEAISCADDIYLKLDKYIELDRIKNLIKESIDPLFNHTSDWLSNETYWTSGLLDDFSYSYFTYSDQNISKLKEEFKDRLIKEKIFDDKEMLYDVANHLSEYCCGYSHTQQKYDLLDVIIWKKTCRIVDKLKKEIEEDKKKKFMDFLDTGLKEVSEEDFLEMYKEFTDDQKALIILNITKKIEEIKNIYKK